MLRKLFQSKKSIEEKKIFEKDEIAKMLRVNPEQLKKFEEAYQCEVLNHPEPSDDLFATNAKDSKKEKDTDVLRKIPEDLVDRIVEELLDGTAYYKYQKGSIQTGIFQGNPGRPVTMEEILEIPEDFRPQLTGHLMQKDINSDDGSAAALYMLQKSMDEKDPRRKKELYDMFRVGLDTLDLDPILYEVLGMNRNSMGHWLPALVDGKGDFFKIPDTTMIKVPLPLLQLTRIAYEAMTPTTMMIVDRYCQKIFELDENKEYFVKTGTFSSKYDFRNAHVWKPKEVRELGEYLLFIHHQTVKMASFFSQPHTYGAGTTNEWVVREFIRDVENNPYIYKGLTLHTEYRVFVDFDIKKVIGIANYWDPDLMKQRFGHKSDRDNPHNIHDYVIYEMHEPILVKRYVQNKDLVVREVEKTLPNIPLTGQWSLDIMQNGNDFYLIDMALAENSALNSCIPKGVLRKKPENWIPQINK